jgi:hypothetical protein
MNDSRVKEDNMRRKAFDMIVTTGGACLVVVLLAAGALGLWGYHYAQTNVHNQLAAQQIYFPARAAFSHAKAGTEITPQMIPYIEKYAGEEVLTGAQAEAYADHFIAYHLAEMPYHGVYANASAAARSLPPGSPAATKAQSEVQTIFTGTTLRGLLLEAYAFWTIGQVALWGAIVAFVLAGLVLVFTLVGLWHYRRTNWDEQFPKSLRNGRVEKTETKELATV